MYDFNGGNASNSLRIRSALSPLRDPALLPPAELFVSANGQSSAPIELNALADQVHVLTACDIVLAPVGTPRAVEHHGPALRVHSDSRGRLFGLRIETRECRRDVNRVGGGLGQTNPAASTGQPVTGAAPTTQTFSLDFNYTVNALAVKPYTGEPDVKPPQPLMRGLRPDTWDSIRSISSFHPRPPNGIPRCALPGTISPEQTRRFQT